MKRAIYIAGGILLAATLSAPAFAGHHHGQGKGGGGESMAGGLPGLEDRVEADEALIATLQSQVAALQGQNNWAVVASDGTISRSSSNLVKATHVATGQYEVTFARDVSGCAYEATIGDITSIPVQGQISVSGDTDTDNPNDVFVQTFDNTGLKAADSPFHLYVSCP